MKDITDRLWRIRWFDVIKISSCALTVVFIWRFLKVSQFLNSFSQIILDKLRVCKQ